MGIAKKPWKKEGWSGKKELRADRQTRLKRFRGIKT
jgi:hypothetical protein